MTTPFDVLVQQNQPAESFSSDWSSYTGRDFAQIFLPRILPDESGDAVFYDGAQLFGKTGSTNQSFPVSYNKAGLSLTCYSFPAGVAADLQQTKARAGTDELLAFFRLTEQGEISMRLQFGGTFRYFLETYYKKLTASAIAQTTYPVTHKELDTALASGADHYNTMRFILRTIGIDAARAEADFQPFEPVVQFPYIALADVEPQQAPPKEFLPFFTDYIRTLSGGSVQHFDGEAQFYRSANQRDGKWGSKDNSYDGTFGFDRYDESRSGKGKLSVKYFPVVDQVSKTYRAPFVSLWAPANKIPHSVGLATGFLPVTEATIYGKLTQEKGKNTSKTQAPAIYFSTGDAAVTINGKTSDLLYKDDAQTPFSVGDDFSFKLACGDLLRDYVPIVFRESGPAGKVIGMLNVVPNNRISTCDIQLIDVQFAPANDTVSNTGKHALADPLEKYLNTYSFNQGFIHLRILPGSTTFKVTGATAGQLLTDYNGDTYIEKSEERELAFHNAMKNAYENQLLVDQGDQRNEDTARINKIIEATDTSRGRKTRIDKTALFDAIKVLVAVVNKKFKANDGKPNRAELTFTDPEVVNAIAAYDAALLEYRKALLAKVLATLEADPRNKDLLTYKEAISIAILNAQEPALGSGSVLNTTNTIYLFLYKMIESFKTDGTNPGGVAGMALTGDGYVHMLNLALGNADPIKRNQLIAHEIGHAFSLRHTFAQTQTSVEDTYKKDLQEEEDRHKTKLEELKKKPVSSASAARVYAHIDKILVRISDPASWSTNLLLQGTLNALISSTTIDQFIEAEKNGSGNATELEENRYLASKTRIAEDKEKALEKTLDLATANTEENFMDYDITTMKSFWYWQWQQMTLDGAPLKEHVL